LMPAPANVAALHLELRPYFLLHGETLTLKRLTLVHCYAPLYTCCAASRRVGDCLPAPPRTARPGRIHCALESTHLQFDCHKACLTVTRPAPFR
jgi:hypothetical protein